MHIDQSETMQFEGSTVVNHRTNDDGSTVAIHNMYGENLTVVMHNTNGIGSVLWEDYGKNNCDVCMCDAL